LLSLFQKGVNASIKVLCEAQHGSDVSDVGSGLEIGGTEKRMKAVEVEQERQASSALLLVMKMKIPHYAQFMCDQFISCSSSTAV
jgi:hypothetical protein